MSYWDPKNWGTGAADIYTSHPEWGSGEMQNPFEQGTMQGSDLFKQSFKNLLGRDPTPQELGQFQSTALFGALPSGQSPGYGDLSNLANSFVQNSYGPEMATHQQQLQTDQLGKTQQTIQDLIGKQTAQTTADLTNPSSPTYQSFSGMMNNLGITPSSGAFQAGLGGEIGKAGANASNAALGAVSLPTISGIQGMNQIPYQFAQGNSDLSHLNSINDFNRQASFGQMMQDMMAPSGFEKGLGYGNTAASMVGNVGKAAGPASTLTSYVCKELIKRGLLCDQEMDDFHVHIMPAMFRKGRAFWKYAMTGKRLVDAVNAKGLRWEAFKPLLFDRVMEEPDPCKAVDLYADACHQLCISADRSLWDGRVYRNSFLDSLIFLPRLLTYKPFLEALWKCIRVKTLVIYDNPKWGHHVR